MANCQFSCFYVNLFLCGLHTDIQLRPRLKLFYLRFLPLRVASLILTRTLTQHICTGFKKHVATQNTKHALAQSSLEAGNAAAEDPSHIPHPTRPSRCFSCRPICLTAHLISRPQTELPCELVGPFPTSSPTSQKLDERYWFAIHGKIREGI